jgi:hypothetical protein
MGWLQRNLAAFDDGAIDRLGHRNEA